MDSIQEMALDIITLLPQIFLCEWFLCRLLSPRNFLGFCVVYGGLNVFLHILFLRILYTSLLIKSIIMLLVNFAIVIAFCSKKWISSISLSAFSYIVLILADVITLAMSQYILQIPFQKSTDALVNAFSPYLFYLRCVYLIVLVLLIFPLSFLKKQIKTENNCYSIWLVPFLIFQCVMLAIAEYSVISANRTSVPLILSLISIAILSCLSMYTTIWAHLKNCAQHQAILRSIELKSYHRALQNQSESVWEKEQQILQLRAELKKRVENICSQLRIHRQDPAKIQVEHASQFIQKYSNHLFCENTVVNAVMQYQSVRCQQFGIHIQTSLDVPSLINIDRLDLCSIFSNILDNAICACSLLPKEQRKIRIGAVVNRNFLIIKETNPCSHTSNLLGTQPNHSGLGLGIIEELVRRRNGDLYIENNETSFCITVCLQRCTKGT